MCLKQLIAKPQINLNINRPFDQFHNFFERMAPQVEIFVLCGKIKTKTLARQGFKR